MVGNMVGDIEIGVSLSERERVKYFAHISLSNFILAGVVVSYTSYRLLFGDFILSISSNITKISWQNLNLLSDLSFNLILLSTD